MNCPKCGSPLNPGDKFCQVCGSAVDQNAATTPQQTPVVETPTTDPKPSVQPVNAAPATPTAPQEPKKSNTLVILLVGIIAILVVAIVAILFLGKDGNGNGGNNGGKDPTPTQVVAPQYSEVTINEYKMKLLPGYQVKDMNGKVILYNDADTVESMIQNIDGNISNMNPVDVVAGLKSEGLDFTYKKTNVEGKEAIIFTGKYNSYDYELVYIQVSPTKVVGGDVIYMSQEDMTTHADNIYKMMALTTVIEPTSQNKTDLFGNFKKPTFK